MGSWELGVGSWELGVGSWEWGMGSGEWGVGSGEWGVSFLLRPTPLLLPTAYSPVGVIYFR
ncbi:hypothetical protein PN459_02900 [Microcystis aeruginosa CS-567/02-A1]|uniref:hypothetical protein n=1 Tax=Microcystis aeruginosa TaxID=1126 RepID=UPI00232CC9CD|nr:hypothetical protein [Microcystis aeruginosa]MDB9398915.1 hypothetical protein [Microcystis aeruginosa CS-567/02-A1]